MSHTSEFREFPRSGSYVAAVERAISACGHVIVDMADFPAAHLPAAEVCAERVRSCDVYLGILGTRYGSPVRDRPEVSYTELEFDTATAAELQRLVFMLDTDAEYTGIPPGRFIDPEFGGRQEAFRRRVRDSGLLTQSFTDPATLGQLVERSLREMAERRRRAAAASPARGGRGDGGRDPAGVRAQDRADHLASARAAGESATGAPGPRFAFARALGAAATASAGPGSPSASGPPAPPASAVGSGIWDWAGRIRRSPVNRRARAAAGITVLAAALLAALLVLFPDIGASSTPHLTGSTRPTPPPRPSASPADCASGTLTLDGSAFGSIAQKAAIAYSSSCKNAHFEFGYGNGKDSAWGIGQLENAVNNPSKARSIIAMYDGTTTLARGLTAHPIGMFIYSVVAHTGLYPGSDITLGALKQLFDEPGCVPGKLAVGLQAGSATRLALLGLLEKVPADPNIPGTCSPPSGHSTENTYEGALGIVSGTSNAIGYMAVDGVGDGHLEIDGHPTNSPNVSVLSIEGVVPTPENVHNGSYHFAAVENLYTVPHPSQLAQSFLAYLPHYLAEHQVPDFISCSSARESMAAECPAPR